MCGISFILDKKENLNEGPIQQMMASLNHRGPDASSFYRHNSDNSTVFFASNRLKISDKSSRADQPFFSEDRTQLLLFNGEIYNFFDLKNLLLQKGIKFSSHSDTEVLLQWIRKYGVDGINDLNGMFAFVYYDFQKNHLIAARDRFGMKPLYYFNSEDYLIISSEIKGIFSTGLVEKELNSEQIFHYFSFRHACPPKTFYKNIFQVEKGRLLELGGQGLKSFTYLTAKIDNEQRADHNIKLYKEKIRESILKQIHADCEVGLLLSGGIDSSLILSIARDEGLNIPSFSVFSTSNKGESKRAQWLTGKYSSYHSILEVDEHLLHDFQDYVNRLDQPIADSAGILTYKICQHASGQVKVLLSGAGADELFAGYNRHLAYYYYLKYQKHLLFLKKIISPGIAAFGAGKNAGIASFLANMERNKRATFLNYVSSHFPHLRNTHCLPDDIQNEYEQDYFEWALQHDRDNYLPEDVLLISDMMSMQAGIEMRMPFLDNDLLSAVNNSKASALIENGRKWMLREMLKEYVPSHYLAQKKQGFGLPLRKWLRSPSSSHLWELFGNKNSLIFDLLNRDFFYNLLSMHQTGKGNVEQELWSILTLAHWLKKEFE